MKYMLLIYSPEIGRDPTPEEWGSMVEPYNAYGEAVRAAGAFVGAAPLAGTSSATTIRMREGKRLITDGPFAETKEYLAGYYIVDCPTLDQAIDLAALCPGAADGSIEIRPIVDVG